MSFFRRKAARLTPLTVSSDAVVPVAYWDHHSRDAVLNVMFRFDHKLDAAKLRDSLEKLLDRKDGWRRLGARVRMDSSGKLNWHIPSTYTAQRPAISYHHLRHSNISIKQHPLASRLRSKATKSSSSSSPISNEQDYERSPWIVESGKSVDFSPLMRQPGDPTSFEDYLYQDKPMIGLQITTFSDATLVSLGFSHIMWDAMGLKALLDAWSLTLQGRQNEVIPLVENDPLESLGSSSETNGKTSHAPEQYKHINKQLGVLQLIALGLRQTLDKILNRQPQEEFRTVCVPASFVKSLRRDALEALQNDESSTLDIHEPSRNKTFLSDGDILTTWWARNIIASRIRNPTTSSQTVSILNMMGVRGILTQAGLLSQSAALVGNAAFPVPALIRARDLVANSPLAFGRASKALRQAIVQLGTRPQVEALLSLQRRSHPSQDDNDKNKGKAGLPALFGDAGMHMIVCTNWTKADLFGVDFSAAAVDEIGCDGLWDRERGDDSTASRRGAGVGPGIAENSGAMGSDGLWEHELALRSKTHGSSEKPSTAGVIAKPSGVHMHLITAGTPAFLMSVFTILGRDSNGNYWIQGLLRKEYWAKIEEALEESKPSRGAIKYDVSLA